MNGTNGTNGTNGLKKDANSPSEAWTQLAQYMPPVNADQDYWWQLTGRHLASLVEAAGYPLDKQYQALVFHYHWTVSPHPFLSHTYRSQWLTFQKDSLYGPSPQI